MEKQLFQKKSTMNSAMGVDVVIFPAHYLDAELLILLFPDA